MCMILVLLVYVNIDYVSIEHHEDEDENKPLQYLFIVKHIFNMSS